jgi:hypothetical protein
MSKEANHGEIALEQSRTAMWRNFAATFAGMVNVGWIK